MFVEYPGPLPHQGDPGASPSDLGGPNPGVESLLKKPASRAKGLKRPAASGETFGAGLSDNVEKAKKVNDGDDKGDDAPKDRYWAKPVRSRSSAAVRGPDANGKEHQVCQVGCHPNQHMMFGLVAIGV